MYTVVEIELSTFVHVQVLHGLANTCSTSHKPPPLHGRDEGCMISLRSSNGHFSTYIVIVQLVNQNGGNVPLRILLMPSEYADPQSSLMNQKT